jgi:hypothetical protein
MSPRIILQVGDSHTVLTFGRELNRHLQSTGAQVTTVASSGSSAASWSLGNYIAKTTGIPTFLKIFPGQPPEVTPAGTVHATPTLASLVERVKPDLVVIALGANMRWMTAPAVQADVTRLARTAVASGARLVWVGPPPQKKDFADASARAAYDVFSVLVGQAVSPFGTYIPSGPFVPAYAGTDGIHFTGEEGEAISRAWARGVFDAMDLLGGLTVKRGAALFAGVSLGFGVGGPAGAAVGGVLGYVAGRWLL